MAADTPQKTGAPAEPVRDHERRDANAKWIFAIIVFLFVFGLSIHGILAGFQSSLKHTRPPTDPWRPPPRPAGAKPVGPPGPRLQVSPPMDLESFRAREEAELHSYGWVNRTSGVVRIPIERAMELVLQQGFPTRSGTQAGPSSYQLMQQRPEHREQEIKANQ
jgi:hypothetical protein